MCHLPSRVAYFRQQPPRLLFQVMVVEKYWLNQTGFHFSYLYLLKKRVYYRRSHYILYNNRHECLPLVHVSFSPREVCRKNKSVKLLKHIKYNLLQRKLLRGFPKKCYLN